MLTDDDYEDQPNGLEQHVAPIHAFIREALKLAPNGAAAASPPAAVAVPAAIVKDIASGKPLSTPTYEALMLHISLATDAFDVGDFEALGLKIEDLSRVADNWDAEVQGRHIRLAAKYHLALYLLDTQSERNKGGAGQHKSKVSSRVTACEQQVLTLEQLNLSRNESSRLQKVAAEVSRDQFFKLLKRPLAKGEKLPTIGSIYRAAGGVAAKRKTTKAKKVESQTFDPTIEAIDLIRALGRMNEKRSISAKAIAEVILHKSKKRENSECVHGLAFVAAVADQMGALSGITDEMETGK